MAEMKRINLRINKQMYDWIKENSEGLGIPMNAMLIMIIRNYIDQQTIIPNVPTIMNELKNREGR